MKYNIKIMPAVLAATLLCVSCNTLKESNLQRRADIQQSKEIAANCFVEMEDGTIQYFSTLTLVKGLFKSPYLLGDGRQRIRSEQIRAYQSREHYAISLTRFACGHRTYVAKETLPGFGIRIAKGPINVFVKKYYNGIAAVDEYFIQQGNDGRILPYTAESMNRMIDNDGEALEFFLNKKLTTPKTRRNQFAVAEKNPEKAITRSNK